MSRINSVALVFSLFVLWPFATPAENPPRPNVVVMMVDNLDNDDVYAYKWRNWKMHLVELENMNSEPMKLNVPRVYNLIADPKEEYNLAAEATWVLPVMFKKIVEFQRTLALEPPIELGTPDPYTPEK